MNRYRTFFRLFLVLLISLFLLLIMTGSASAEKDFYDVYFHPFTLGTILNGCPSKYDGDTNQTVYNCDPINVIFPGRTWEEARDLFPSEEGWTTDGSGSIQRLHFDGTNTYEEDGRLFKTDGIDTRYHIRFWQAPPGGPLVTFASVHHESGSVFHTIDMDWELAEAHAAGLLCASDCDYTDPLTEQIGIQGPDGEWRGWLNNGSATVIPAPSMPNPTTMHVGDLDGDSVNVKKNWQAEVTVTIHDENEAGISGATINGTWSGDISGPGSCTITSGSSSCTISSNAMPKKGTESVIFAVDNVSLTGMSYEPDDNHYPDPDNDSSGTAIQVNKDGTAQDPGPVDPPGNEFWLTVAGYKVKGVKQVDLTWGGATSENVDIFRNNTKIATSPNSDGGGFYTDNTEQKGGGSYTYRVCEEIDTSTCSDDAIVEF